MSLMSLSQCLSCLNVSVSPYEAATVPLDRRRDPIRAEETRASTRPSSHPRSAIYGRLCGDVFHAAHHSGLTFTGVVMRRLRCPGEACPSAEDDSRRRSGRTALWLTEFRTFSDRCSAQSPRSVPLHLDRLCLEPNRASPSSSQKAQMM